MRKSRRGGAKRLDVSTFRELFADERTHTAIGVVRQFEGETSHYEIDATDVFVDVELAPHGEKVLCRLASAGGGAGGIGFWFIPPIGSEVAVLIPHGELDEVPVIVATLSSGTVPDGLAPSIAVIAVPSGGQLLIHDGLSGDAVPLVKKPEFDAHTHALPALQVPIIGSVGTTPVEAGITTSPGNVAAPAAITGTTILKAK